MPPSVANFLSSPAKISKNINLSQKGTSPTSSDPSAFPHALERAERFEAQKPREAKPVSDESASKVSKKSSKAQPTKKGDKKRPDDAEETTDLKTKETKTRTVDQKPPTEPETEETDAPTDPEKKVAEKKDPADPTDAQAALLQSAAQPAPTPAPTPHAESADPDAQKATDERDADGKPIAAIAADGTVAQTDGGADSDSDQHADADSDTTEDAIAKALANSGGTQKASKEPAAKSAKVEADAEPGLGASADATPHARSHPSHSTEKLDDATRAFSAMTAIVTPPDSGETSGSEHASKDDGVDAATFDAMLASSRSTTGETSAQKLGPASAPTAPPPAPEARFALENHDKIVSSVKSELLPGGGTMKIKLDPPELGPMAVAVHMRDGVMTATFETSSDEAAKLLSHSLGQLKSSLEAQGISVEKLHVQQTPKSADTSSSGEDSQQHRDGQSPQQEASARQEQQRKDMLRRMWRKLSGFADPLDVTG